MIILIKSVVNQDKNKYYCHIFLEKGLYKDKSNTPYFQMNVCILQMLCFNRIDVSERIAVNKTNALKACDIYHYGYFLNYSFKFQPNVFNWCHHLIMMSINLNKIAILNIKGSGYCCIISLIIKNKAISLMRNTDVTEKKTK